jgi:hypothetical protein
MAKINASSSPRRLAIAPIHKISFDRETCSQGQRLEVRIIAPFLVAGLDELEEQIAAARVTGR